MTFEYMQRDGFCRLCDGTLKRGDGPVLKHYSRRNRGQHILICRTCVLDAADEIREFKGKIR